MLPKANLQEVVVEWVGQSERSWGHGGVLRRCVR
jgi:hypothetical protein